MDVKAKEAMLMMIVQNQEQIDKEMQSNYVLNATIHICFKC